MDPKHERSTYEMPGRGLSAVNEKLLPWARVAVAIAVMLALTTIVIVFKVPNPNMILIAGLVVCSSVFGPLGGVPAAAVMLGYTLYFFSTGHNLVTFDSVNMTKVVVTLIGVVVVTGFVCALKRREDKAFTDIEHLAEVLQEDNHLLEQATTVDPLTHVKNRFALRHDYDSYEGLDLCVAMLDIDNFKLFNDHYGHECGDRVLEHVSRELVAVSGSECVYRSGGDEFLITSHKLDPSEFEASFTALKGRVDPCVIGSAEMRVELSGGYVYGRDAWHDDLRAMLRQADQYLYKSKNSGKSRLTGSAYDAAPRTRQS